MNVGRITPQQAYQRDNSVLIDVRSSMEFLFVGHPLKSVNIAWIDEPNWQINPNFVEQITQHLNKKIADINAVDIVLICRSGVRSVAAGNALIANGFTRVFSIDEGFEGDIDDDGHRGELGGWRMRGLPWVQG